jgi:3-hydroxy-9,10-secoandrosta-1,3,5(10)-triene-9,17-dione monooxygenase reductase component
MSNATTVTADDFKGALASWAAGVTVVTTRHEGLMYGLTVSSFSSLSLEPRLILVCLADSNRMPKMIEASRHFGVSILAEGQEEISGYFAVSGREPVASYEFEMEHGITGSPLIRGSIAHIDCEVENLVEGGDHTIAIGRVVHAAFDGSKLPLVYYRRGYRALQMD